MLERLHTGCPAGLCHAFGTSWEKMCKAMASKCAAAGCVLAYSALSLKSFWQGCDACSCHAWAGSWQVTCCSTAIGVEAVSFIDALLAHVQLAQGYVRARVERVQAQAFQQDLLALCLPLLTQCLTWGMLRFMSGHSPAPLHIMEPGNPSGLSGMVHSTPNDSCQAMAVGLGGKDLKSAAEGRLCAT